MGRHHRFDYRAVRYSRFWIDYRTVPGSILGEMLSGSGPSKSMKVGFGSVIGLFSDIVVKVILQLAMIVIFFIWIF